MMYVTTLYDILGKYKDSGDGDGSELDQVFLYLYYIYWRKKKSFTQVI